MHDILRERLWRNIEALPEERLYQVLDYVEFLGSKYAREGVRSPSSLRKFGERLEDQMRMNGVGLSAIRGTMEAMGTADRLVADLTQAGRTLIREVEDGLRSTTEPRDRADVRNLPPPPPKDVADR